MLRSGTPLPVEINLLRHLLQSAPFATGLAASFSPVQSASDSLKEGLAGGDDDISFALTWPYAICFSVTPPT